MTRAQQAEGSPQWAIWLGWGAWLSLILAWMALDAPRGIEGHDTGFIMGLAHQVAQGGRMFSDIVCVRPPVSPWLHSLFFHGPMASAPILWDRCFVACQLGLSSAWAVLAVAPGLRWRAAVVPWVAGLGFVVAAHNFPLMAWHTIDGIFFSAMAIWVWRCAPGPWWCRALGAGLAAWLAAGSKQPFYLTPLLLAGLQLTDPQPWRERVLAVLVLTASLGLVLLGLSPWVSVPDMWAAISAQTTGKDLLDAGVANYLFDLSRPLAWVGAWPLIAVLAWRAWRPASTGVAWAVLAGSAVLWALTWRYFHHMAVWGAPYFLYDTLFVGATAWSAWMAWRTRQPVWRTVLALQGVAWASSISWGYQSQILFAVAALIPFVYVWQGHPRPSRALAVAGVASVLAAGLAFREGHRLYFSGEMVIPRSSLSEPLPALQGMAGIRTSPELAQRFGALMQLVKRHPGPFLVLPNTPLAHVWAGEPNPIGIDWPMNAEVGHALPRLRARLAARVAVVIVDRASESGVADPGKFGSALTADVMRDWRLVETTADYKVYLPPGR